MSESFDALYLAPHLDDAALSCGGQIAQRCRAGQQVAVLTVFAGDEPEGADSPLVRQMHALFGLAEGVVAARRSEDIESCRRLGAAAIHWEGREAVYRTDPATGEALYSSVGDLFGDVHPADGERIQVIARRLRSLRVDGDVVAPLGIGGHVDHQLVRQAAEQAFTARLAYYEDYPYVEKWRSLRRTLTRKSEWKPEVIGLEEPDLAAKIAAVAAHESQMAPLFGTGWRMERRLRRAAQRRGGERIWRRR